MKTDRPAEALRKRKYNMGRRKLSGEARPEAILRGKVLCLLYDEGGLWTGLGEIAYRLRADLAEVESALAILLEHGSVEKRGVPPGPIQFRPTCECPAD